MPRYYKPLSLNKGFEIFDKLKTSTNKLKLANKLAAACQVPSTTFLLDLELNVTTLDIVGTININIANSFALPAEYLN